MSGTYSSQNFNLFALSKKLVLACYELTSTLPPEEKTNLTQYIRNAALSAHINIVEGAFLKGIEVKEQYLTGALHSMVIIDAAVDVLVEVELVTAEAAREVMQLSSECYEELDRLQKEK